MKANRNQPWPLFVLLGALCSALLSCSLMVSEEGMSGHKDQGAAGEGSSLGCTDSEKVCAVDGPAECVAATDPDFGCSIQSCSPCDLPQAVPRCSVRTGECVVSSCIENFRNCNTLAEDGCEAAIMNSKDHCGACDRPCTGTCLDGICVQP